MERPGVTAQALVRLETIAPSDYIEQVLPATFPLWGAGRTFERYVEDFRAIAASAYGKRRPFTVGLREHGRIVCSCKNYDRELRVHDRALRATGIGAVYTPENERGRGFASVMFGAMLDGERAAGRDLAFLYSDIHPAFYERLGFKRLPSRLITLRAASLDGSHSGAVPLETKDWPAVRRCFDALDLQRPWGLRRTPLVWDLMRSRWNAPLPPGSQAVHLVVRRARTVLAYVIGRRVLREDAFVMDDFAFDGDDGRAALEPLLRAAAGDLRRVTGWLPPEGARDALPRGSVRVRKDAILMIAPLSAAARAWWAQNKDAIASAGADATWSADHI
jgi:predicted N-acetyltransferase YhbS